MAGAEEENQQFEQVLTRLDALMKRSHSATPSQPDEAEWQMLEITLPPPEAAEETENALPEAAPETAESPFFILEEKETADIPVLTDVYEGTVPPRNARAESVDAIVEALLPAMLENLDIIVAEEAAKMQQAIAERLRAEIGEALRQRLLRPD